MTEGYAIAFLGELSVLTGDYAKGATLVLARDDAGAGCAILDSLICEIEAAGLPQPLSHALSLRGTARLATGDFAMAGADFREARALAVKMDNRWLIALADHSLGQLARQQQQAHRARALLHDALGLRVANKWLPGVVDSLEALAGLAAEQQCLLEATRLFGAVLTLRNTIGMARWPTAQHDYDHTLARLCAALGAIDFAREWAQGEGLSVAEAVAYAASVVFPSPSNC